MRLAAGNEPQGCGESQRWHRDVPSLMVTEASRSARDQAAAGIGPGVKGAWPYAPLPPPSARGGQITLACKAEPDHSEPESTSNLHSIYGPNEPANGSRQGYPLFRGAGARLKRPESATR